jgi:hypothetical protein
MFNFIISAQPLTGSKTIDNSGSGDYTTFSAAITALNANGVGTGGVTLLVTDGQTFNSAPLTITATGTSENPIIFKKSGSGVRPIIIFTGTSGTQAGFQLNASDYVTFDGFDIRDAGTAMEIGFQLYGSASDGCQYNTIKNCVINLDKAGTNDNGIHVQSNATSFAGTNSYNKFYNNVITDCYKGYYFYGYSDMNADYGNEINTTSGGVSKIDSVSYIGLHFYNQKNFLVNNTSFTNFINASYGIYMQAGAENTVTVSNCEFKNIISSGTVYTIRTLGDTINIFNNKISEIIYTGASSSNAYGLYITATTANIYNNMISGINAVSSTNSTAGACGIWLQSGITVNMFYNSVLLNYSSAVATNRSAALYIPPLNHTLINFSNNIFINNVDVTTGALAVAFMKGTSGKYINNLSTESNNNLYYAGTPSSKNLILYDGTTSCQTIEEYKTYVSSRPLDQKAITENVPFVSSNVPYDLHIDNSIATLLESAGIPITSPLAIITDLDGDVRSATSPDIGADEGNFLSNDINPPDISYTLLSHTESTLNRAVTGVVITDYSGINVSPGTKPRLYFKRNKDSNDYTSNTSSTNGWKWIETNNASSPFEFTIDYSLLFNSGASAGDVIQYFITAQDNNSTPNVQINSGTFNLQPASVAMNASAFPITGNINSYSISFNGTYSVGSGYKYTSLTQVNGLFEAISAGSFSGNVEIQITSDLTENGVFALSQWQETGGGNYTLTISPFSNEMKTISGSSESGLIKIFGCSRVIFDGRYSGSGNYLTFKNTNTTGSVFNIANRSWNNILQYIKVKSASYNIDNAAIKFGSDTNLDNIVQNCEIRNLSDSASTLLHGIYVAGAGNRNTQILNNSIHEFTSSAIILHGGCENTLIEGNLIYQSSPSQLGVYGIYLKNSKLSKVFRNKIYGLDGTSAVFGIYYEGSSAVISTQIINNMITLSPTAGSIVGGIVYSGNVNNSLTVYHNSVYIGGTLASGPYVSYTFAKLSDVEVLRVKNNIFVNGRTNSGGTGNHYAVYFGTMQGADYFNYNNYYSVIQNGFYGWFANPITDLATWRQRSLFDLDSNSIAINPNFISTFDLHLNTTITPHFLAGAPLGVTTDFDGDIRNINKPYMGCDEDAAKPLAVGDEPLIPDKFVLEQNHPNPFNPTTIISYQLSVSSWVTLKVFDVLGRELATLVNEKKEAGYHNFEFRISNSELASGVYFYRLTAGDFVQTKKLLLMK